MNDPYRVASERPSPEKNPHPRVGKGTRDCPKPQFWSRWWHGFRYQDTWTCDCGETWMWRENAGGIGGYWAKVQR